MARPRTLKQKYRPSGAGTRIYLPKNVHDAALERIDRLYDEFDNRIVCRVSGGKDSTVLLHLALKVAEARGRLPLKIFWVDQEAEWVSTVDITREWMSRDDVEPHWLQVPFRITNATSMTDKWFVCWDPEREADWMRPKDPLAIHDNTFGTDRLKELFAATLRAEFGGLPCGSLSGVRAEESPNRLKGLTYYATYKDITWGGVEDKERQHFNFYPLYDWSWTDIWKCILDEGLAYNRLYDLQYRYGVHLQRMRVSALQHETAVASLFHLQEFEPDTYERLVKRVKGIDMAGKFGKADYFPRELPFMFDSWGEYRDYLLEHLVDDEARPKFQKVFAEQDRKLPPHLYDEGHKVHVTSILTQDRELVKSLNWFQSTAIWQAQKDNKAAWLPPGKSPVRVS